MGKKAEIQVERYLSIADELGAEIRAGKYLTHRSFPSLTLIMRRFGVSRPTAMRSVAELKARGFIATAPRSGIFVKPRAGSRKIGLIVPA